MSRVSCVAHHFSLGIRDAHRAACLRPCDARLRTPSIDKIPGSSPRQHPRDPVLPFARVCSAPFRALDRSCVRHDALARLTTLSRLLPGFWPTRSTRKTRPLDFCKPVASRALLGSAMLTPRRAFQRRRGASGSAIDVAFPSFERLRSRSPARRFRSSQSGSRTSRRRSLALSRFASSRSGPPSLGRLLRRLDDRIALAIRFHPFGAIVFRGGLVRPLPRNAERSL